MAMFFPVLAIALSLCISNVDAATSLPQPVKLEWHYYKVHNICHDAEVYIRHQVELMMKTDKYITAKLLRLAYSDCFVSGCDASILLDGPDSEKTAPQNRGLGGFVVIDKIKTVLESRCKGKVSCADILQLATRDAVHMAGGPSYPVFTGRRDGMTSKASSVDLPSPSISWQNALKYFKSRGLDVLDMVTLLGAHSIGKTHCRQVEDRLYNNNNTLGPSMNATSLAEMRKLCPPRVRKGQSDLLVFLNPESGSSYKLTKSYYSRILTHEAVLGIDQQLLLGEDTKTITQEFAADFEDFRKSLALSMSRMGSISVLTGQQGEIRENCQVTNANLHKY
ncbi:Peroxidase superfamily protein [Tripterygium wilfordii]|uniref:Peroxidase n=1 Tax=Tripterygium wilfordii TaxID=458696 RepID=A0A7J7C3T0_TRIWF|nr:probable peroxidase 61 [Tripterygium wilfordii]KAF5728794.1 Peroxidase superfamily protein [Tripterygium wilfordii]